MEQFTGCRVSRSEPATRSQQRTYFSFLTGIRTGSRIFSVNEQFLWSGDGNGLRTISVHHVIGRSGEWCSPCSIQRIALRCHTQVPCCASSQSMKHVRTPRFVTGCCILFSMARSDSKSSERLVSRSEHEGKVPIEQCLWAVCFYQLWFRFLQIHKCIYNIHSAELMRLQQRERTLKFYKLYPLDS